MPEHLVFVGIGSNIDPEENIACALERLSRQTAIEAVSTFYRTAPVGRPEQPPFLNGAARLRTTLDAATLKSEVLCGIESALGRVRTADACAPRTIDLDILLFDSAIIEEPGLRVPDPGIRERPFVAVPLLELVPDLVLPDTGEKLAGLSCARRREGLIPADAFTESLRERLGL